MRILTAGTVRSAVVLRCANIKKPGTVAGLRWCCAVVSADDLRDLKFAGSGNHCGCDCQNLFCIAGRFRGC